MSRAEAVIAAVAGEMAKPYAFGVSDCFLLGCRVIDAVRGTAHALTYGGRYTTLAGAQKALRKEGCKGLGGFFRDRVGLLPKAAGDAVIGDIGILDLGGAEHVAVFTGTAFLTKTERGPERFGIEFCKAAFKV